MFVYTAQYKQDNGPLTITGPINLNGGTIKGSDGTDASLSFAPVDASGVIFDTTPPATPVILGITPASPTSDQTIVVNGTGDPGSDVGFAGTGTQVDANGNWSMRFGPLVAGTYTYAADATDEAGNESENQAHITFTVQPAASAPVITGITPPEPKTYGITMNDTAGVTVTFSGAVTVTGRPTLTVRIGSTDRQFSYVGGPFENQVLFQYQTVSGDNGPLTITGPINLNGGSITSGGQNASLAFAAVAAPGVTYDTTAPAAPNIRGVTPAVPTAADSFTISGTAEPNAHIAYGFLDGHDLTTADANGNWSVQFLPTAAGTYTFTANADDEVFNQSPPSSITITILPAPPPSTPPSPAGSATQTITFASPTSAVMIGQPIPLGATSSAGLPIAYSVVSGDATLSGNVLTPRSTATLVVRASSAGDATYGAATADVNFGNPQKAVQAIAADTAPQTVKPGATVTLAASSTSGLPVTYSLVSGPATVTGNTLAITGSSGTVLVRASQTGNDTTAAASDVTLQFDIVPVPISRLVNISSRLHVTANDAGGASIAGFVIPGTSPKQILIRGVGPGLTIFGVSAPLATPQLTVYDNGGKVIAANAGWNDDPRIAAAGGTVGAFKLAAGSKDAALLITLSPGAYTVQIHSADTGTALVEVYDVSGAVTSSNPLVNISTRGAVGSGDDVLIGGFVISGDQPKRVLIRGVGPTMGNFVGDALSDAVLTLYDAKQAVVARNDNWGVPQPLLADQSLGSAADIAAAASATGAFALPTGSADAALLITLNPGTYTVIVSGANGAHGTGMVEVYEVPQ